MKYVVCATLISYIGYDGAVKLEKVESGHIQIAVKCTQLSPVQTRKQCFVMEEQIAANELEEQKLDNATEALKKTDAGVVNQIQGLLQECEVLTTEIRKKQSTLSDLKKKGI